MLRVFLPLLLAAACTAPPPAPVPDRVEPAWGYVGDDTLVRVIGTRFYPSLQIPAGGGPAGTDDAFELRLWGADASEPVELLAEFESLNALRALVPSGLPVGRYDVEVVSPAGIGGVKADAFEVTSTRVDRVVIDVNDFVGTVGETLQVVVQVVDPEGRAVVEDLAVRVEVDAEDAEAVDLTLDTSDLEQRVPSPTGLGATGRLGSDGRVVVGLTATRPGSVRLIVGGDEGVGADEVNLQWTPGAVFGVRASLGDVENATVTAGERFVVLLELVDASGNLVPDGRADLLVSSECGSYKEAADVVRGYFSLDVEIDEATSRIAGCSAERLEVVSRDGRNLQGRSAPFTVVPGPLQDLRVRVVGPTTVAAGELVPVTVEPLDAFGNRPVQTVTLSDIRAPLDDRLDWSCPAQITPTTDGFCQIRPTLAQAGVSFSVEGTYTDDGLPSSVSGTSQSVVVGPGRLARLEVGLEATTWVAGDPQVVDVAAFDAYDNAIPAGSVDPSALRIFDARFEAGPPSPDQVCTAQGVAGRWRCRTTVATRGTDTRVVAEWKDPLAPSTTVRGQSVPVRVQNSILAAAVITPSASEATAGVPLDVRIEATDAYGNAYLDQTVISVLLRDSTGTMLPRSVTLGPDGTATPRAVFTRTGSTRVTALIGGVELGVSAPIQVVAGDLSGLSVLPGSPFGWVGEPVSVRVESIDAYGNRVPRDRDVTVRSRDGRGAPVAFRLVNGVGVGSFTWTTWDDEDALEATSAELSGSSGVVAAMLRCPTGAPVVGVGFPVGQVTRSYGLACTDDDGDASVWVDLASSLPAAGLQILRYGAALGASGVSGPSTGMRVTVPSAGRWPLSAYVVQSDGCGAVTDRLAYAGADDGRVVGPLQMVARPAQVDLEREGAGADLELDGVLTCRGLLADDTWVRVRADLGALTGASLDGGAGGLRLGVDQGHAEVRLDLSEVEEGDPARVLAWVDGGQAQGAVDVPLDGDLRSPTVWRQLPRGVLASSTGSLLLELSEPLDPASLGGGAVRVEEGGVPLTVTPALSGRLLTLQVSPPLRADGTVYEVILEDRITDLAGNGLAGTWQGAPATYRRLVGAIGAPDAVTTCSVDTPILRPDGFAGVGVEADEVVVDFASPSVPAWWVIEVRDAQGFLVRYEQLVPTDADGSWTWDARDAEGRVVDAGTYTVSLDAEGNGGNRGGACTRAVSVEVWEPAP
ncbi:MAG: hypothetical protein H6732_05470 [Alphaproteobacteria bacterium]|nr:hypothetical protein [Alphaproteobacteria bacterium]